MRPSWHRDALFLSQLLSLGGEPQCFGLTGKDLESMHVAQAGVFLRPDEIAAVADYVIGAIKGKGDPGLADCVAFFGEGSKACDVYKEGGHHRCRRPRQRSDRGPRLRARPVFVALGLCALLNASGGVAAKSLSICTTSTSACWCKTFPPPAIITWRASGRQISRLRIGKAGCPAQLTRRACAACTLNTISPARTRR